MNVSKYSSAVAVGAPSLITNMPESRYHTHFSISKSGLDQVERSPAHYDQAPQREATRAMEIGSAIHAALLEPDRFAEDWLVLDVKDKRQKEWKDATAERGTGFVLTANEAEAITAMQAAMKQHSEAQRLISGGLHCELSAFAHDPVTGVTVRCRYDMVTSGSLVDLKKTIDARSDPFARSVWNYRYHVQAALYSDIWQWLTGEYRPFKFIAVEPQHPFSVEVYELDDDALAEGRRAYRRNLNTYSECLGSGVWPKYEAEHKILSLPGFAIAQIENELEVSL